MPRKRKIPEAVPINMAAELLSVHHITIRRWIRYGFIGAVRVGPRVIRIPRSEIARLRKFKIIPALYPSDKVRPSTGRH